MRKVLLVAFIAITSMTGMAQILTPASSTSASVSTTVGLTEIRIDYSRPKAKGRKIFGKDASSLVPYGAIWRTGANGGTIIKFSDNVTVEGTTIPKGEYLLLSWPGESEWTISLYKDVNLGGNTAGYDATNDVVKFKVKAEKVTEKVETFTMNITDLSDDNKSAKIQISWENTSVKFKVGVEFDKRVMESIAANTKVSSGSYLNAAVYYYENGKDIKQALEWITKAADENPQFWVLYQKARIQKAAGDKTGALKSANESLAASIKANNRDYQKMNEELIASLK